MQTVALQFANALQRCRHSQERLSVCEATAAPATIVDLFRQHGIPREVDLFSLDIDLDTYHVWAALNEFRPRVAVVEYNASFPPDQIWIHPYGPNRRWVLHQAFGASLKALEVLGRQFGYSLVGCDLVGVNAFFGSQ